jgi:hypothetical protein
MGSPSCRAKPVQVAATASEVGAAGLAEMAEMLYRVTEVGAGVLVVNKRGNVARRANA